MLILFDLLSEQVLVQPKWIRLRCSMSHNIDIRWTIRGICAQQWWSKRPASSQSSWTTSQYQMLPSNSIHHWCVNVLYCCSGNAENNELSVNSSCASSLTSSGLGSTLRTVTWTPPHSIGTITPSHTEGTPSLTESSESECTSTPYPFPILMYIFTICHSLPEHANAKSKLNAIFAVDVGRRRSWWRRSGMYHHWPLTVTISAIFWSRPRMFISISINTMHACLACAPGSIHLHVPVVSLAVPCKLRRVGQSYLTRSCPIHSVVAHQTTHELIHRCTLSQSRLNYYSFFLLFLYLVSIIDLGRAL